jgi:hypothetical protein
MAGNRNTYMVGAGLGALVGGARGFALGGDPVSGAVAGAGFGAGVAARRDILTMHGEEGIVARGVLRGMGGGGGYGGYGHGGYGGYAPAAYRPMMYGGGQPIIIDRSPPSWGSGEYRGYGHGGGGYGAARYAAPQMPSDISGIIANLARTFLGGERAVPAAGSPVYVPQGRPTSYREIPGYAPSPATVYAQQSAQPQQAPALRVQGAEDVTASARAIPVTPSAVVERQPLGAYPMCLDPAISTNVPLGRDFRAAASAQETPAGPSRLQELAAGKEHGRFDPETYAKALKSLPAGPSPS